MTTNVKDQLHNMITDVALKLLDAVDIMNDGPDDSDITMAHGRFNEAVNLAKEWKRLYKQTYNEYPKVHT